MPGIPAEPRGAARAVRDQQPDLLCPLLPADSWTVRRYRRRPGGPAATIRLPSIDLAYLVLDDVERVLRDRRFSRNFRHQGAAGLTEVDDMSANPDAIVNLDPPEHTRLRRTVRGALVVSGLRQP